MSVATTWESQIIDDSRKRSRLEKENKILREIVADQMERMATFNNREEVIRYLNEFLDERLSK